MYEAIYKKKKTVRTEIVLPFNFIIWSMYHDIVKSKQDGFFLILYHNCILFYF